MGLKSLTDGIQHLVLAFILSCRNDLDILLHLFSVQGSI